jgi:hypothetical protein
MFETVANRLNLLRKRRGPDASELSPCCIVTRLSLPGRDVDLDGVVLNIGPEWALFREAAIHLFDRSGEAVLLALDGDSVPGRIMSTDKRGFWIAFEEPIEEQRLRDCVMRHGVDPVLVV